MNNYELRITNYEEAIRFLFDSLPVWERAGADAYKPGLERIAAFMSTLGLDGVYSPCKKGSHVRHCEPERRSNPEMEGTGLLRHSAPRNDVRMHPTTIHVAGTNGKGSVCHMLAAVLQSAGYRTGLFTSPHLVDFRERIRVGGEMIPEAAVVEFTGRYRDEMVRTGLTFFEMTTAMALWWFSKAECDVAVIETGLGGRLDSTNIVTPAVSVITNIGLEHTQYLGDTVAAIAAEKAGIIKPWAPVVIGETDPESAPVFRAAATALGSEIVFADKSNYETSCAVPGAADGVAEPGRRSAADENNYELDLAGDYQRKNLATVLATVEVLRRTLTIPDDALLRGLASAAAITGLRGRWQVVRRDPPVVLDTAHNAHGLANVMRQIARQKYDRLYMVLGFAGDKDTDAIIPLLPRGAHYILTAADTPRAMPPEELAKRFSLLTHEVSGNVPEALARALALAGPGDMLFVGGSNFVVGEALAALDC